MPLGNLPFLSFLLMTLLVGCAANRTDVPWPEPAPLGRDIKAYRPLYESPQAGSKSQEIREPSGIMTLRDALSLALMYNPELAAFSWQVRVEEAKMLQEGLLPNPELEVEIEEFGGAGERSGLDAAETTLLVSQLIELGGKRSKRVMVASIERDLGRWDYESKRLDVFTETTAAFVDVLTAQEKLNFAEETSNLANRILDAVTARVEAGKVSPLEQTKATVAFSTSQIGLEKAKRELKSARKRLAAMWGNTLPVFASVEHELEDISEIPPLENLLQEVFQNPDIARWETEIEMRQAAVDLEKAKGLPDLTVGAGPRRFEDTDDYAVTVVMAVPIPLFDRNQGSISEAQHRLAKAAEERKAAIIQVKTALSEAYQTLSSSNLEAATLKTTVLPAAQLALDAAREGYQAGKFGYQDVLDAQRTLFEVKANYIDALAGYHKAKAEMERLIGRRLDERVE